MNSFGKINFQDLKHDDKIIQQIIQIDQEQMPYFWEQGAWIASLADSNFHCFYHLDEELKNVVSFALLCSPEVDEVAHLLKIATKKQAQRSGQAQVLLHYGCTQMLNINKKSIYLEVAVGNHQAISFYEKNGFIALGKVKQFYSDGQDALKMHLILGR